MYGICTIALNENSQHLSSDSVLLPAIERLTVEVYDSSIASLRTTQLTLTTKLKPGNGQNRPVRERERERERTFLNMFVFFSLKERECTDILKAVSVYSIHVPSISIRYGDCIHFIVVQQM